jgi:hypothetical protein
MQLLTIYHRGTGLPVNLWKIPAERFGRMRDAALGRSTWRGTGLPEGPRHQLAARFVPRLARAAGILHKSMKMDSNSSSGNSTYRCVEVMAT